MKDSKTEPANEAKERIEREAIDASYNIDDPSERQAFYFGYIAGATAEYNRAQEEITRLKAELERERELRNGKLSEIRTYHQTLIARFYNNNSFDQESLSKIIDELETMLK